MNDDQLSLASAYLADDVSDDERARVEADPELLAIVDRLRSVSGALAATAPPPDDVRERAITAALSAWDDTAARPTTVTPMRRRPLSSRVLGIAAACVALAAVGAVVVAGQRGNDDLDSVAIEEAGDTADDGASDSAERLDAPASATASDLADATADIEDRAFEAGPDDADGESGDATIMAGEADGGSSPAPTLSATGAAPAVADEAELAALVRLLLETTDAPDTTDAPEGDTAGTAAPALDDAVACEGLVARELGDAVYDGVPVVVGVDADVARARAFDPVDCSLVADTPLDTGTD